MALACVKWEHVRTIRHAKDITMTLVRVFPRRRAAPWICVLMSALASPIAGSQTQDTDDHDTSMAALKEAYLACDRATMSRVLAGFEAMQCSVVYEELKRRAFDGDFQKLFAWSRAQNPPAAAGGGPAPGRTQALPRPTSSGH